MATTGILRARRSVAQLHATASVEREIRSFDPAGGRKYLRDFYEAYRSYETVLHSEQVRTAIAETDIALIADYHALPSSQRYLASVLRDAEVRQRPLVVGVETIFSRDQHIVDEWWRGEIDEAELRQRIRFDLDWGYDWAPFYELLSAARERAAGLYGLDCMPREDLRKIGARDRHAAEKIAEIRRRHPEALILVLFGESHLAPRHLPVQVRSLLPEDRMLTVLQNVDALYWRAAGEKLDHVGAVRVASDVLCVFNATPLEKYEHYRLYLNHCVRDDSGAPDLGPTVFNLVDGLVRFLGINLYSVHNTTQPRMLVDLMPEVYSRNSDALLRRLLSRKGFSAAQRRSILRRVRERGSAYLAPLNAFYIRKFEMIPATEDAARFLHHACRGVPDRVNGKGREPRGPEDAFFAATLENALACFGSRILYPARPAFRDAELQQLFELTREDLEQQSSLPYSDVAEVLDFLAWHR
ncbi:MAG: ChaN family lipoprotein, partial [Terriglobales bacterium]